MESAPDERDCFAMAFEYQSIICGRIRLFFAGNDQEYAVIEKYKTVSSYASPVISYVPVHSFYIIKETDEVIVVHKKLLLENFFTLKCRELCILSQCSIYLNKTKLYIGTSFCCNHQVLWKTSSLSSVSILIWCNPNQTIFFHIVKMFHFFKKKEGPSWFCQLSIVIRI